MVTENCILHIRVLTEIFLSEGRTDDIKISQILPEWREENKVILEELYPLGGSPSHCVDLGAGNPGCAGSKSKPYQFALQSARVCLSSSTNYGLTLLDQSWVGHLFQSLSDLLGIYTYRYKMMNNDAKIA